MSLREASPHNQVDTAQQHGVKYKHSLVFKVKKKEEKNEAFCPMQGKRLQERFPVIYTSYDYSDNK